MEAQAAQRALRTIEDLLALQSQRSQERLQAVREGIEEYVTYNQAKTNIVLKSMSDSPSQLNVKV
jgi:hypothetical protein